MNAGLDPTGFEKALRTRETLPKKELLAHAGRALEAKKATHQRNASRRSPEKRQTQRCTAFEKLNAV